MFQLVPVDHMVCYGQDQNQPAFVVDTLLYFENIYFE